MNFLHNFEPSAIAITLGPLVIYWYGICMALAILAALILAMKNAKLFSLDTELIIDLAIWLVISGLIGARIYEIFLNFSYYVSNPAEILQIWHGGLAIHGALIGGLIGLVIFSKRKKLDCWLLAAILLPAVALGQAIGRWGNWFNQELFGLPSNLPWSIPVQAVNRPIGYETFIYFHPTFLYESIGCLVLAICLYYVLRLKKSSELVIGIYLIGYGLLRFMLEYIKIDPTPHAFGLRWPQVMSLVFIILGIWIIAFKKSYKTY